MGAKAVRHGASITRELNVAPQEESIAHWRGQWADPAGAPSAQGTASSPPVLPHVQRHPALSPEHQTSVGPGAGVGEQPWAEEPCVGPVPARPRSASFLASPVTLNPLPFHRLGLSWAKETERTHASRGWVVWDPPVHAAFWGAVWLGVDGDARWVSVWGAPSSP